MTELYIIRHGQTAANVAGLKQGTIDDERTYLSETGIAQAKGTGRRLGPDWFCRPLPLPSAPDG